MNVLQLSLQFLAFVDQLQAFYFLAFDVGLLDKGLDLFDIGARARVLLQLPPHSALQHRVPLYLLLFVHIHLHQLDDGLNLQRRDLEALLRINELFLGLLDMGLVLAQPLELREQHAGLALQLLEVVCLFQFLDQHLLLLRYLEDLFDLDLPSGGRVILVFLVDNILNRILELGLLRVVADKGLREQDLSRYQLPIIVITILVLEFLSWWQTSSGVWRQMTGRQRRGDGGVRARGAVWRASQKDLEIE